VVFLKSTVKNRYSTSFMTLPLPSKYFLLHISTTILPFPWRSSSILTEEWCGFPQVHCQEPLQYFVYDTAASFQILPCS
jgi:hypothetical protein